MFKRLWFIQFFINYWLKMWSHPNDQRECNFFSVKTSGFKGLQSVDWDVSLFGFKGSFAKRRAEKGSFSGLKQQVCKARKSAYIQLRPINLTVIFPNSTLISISLKVMLENLIKNVMVKNFLQWKLPKSIDRTGETNNAQWSKCVTKPTILSSSNENPKSSNLCAALKIGCACSQLRFFWAPLNSALFFKSCNIFNLQVLPV